MPSLSDADIKNTDTTGCVEYESAPVRRSSGSTVNSYDTIGYDVNRAGRGDTGSASHTPTSNIVQPLEIRLCAAQTPPGDCPTLGKEQI